MCQLISQIHPFSLYFNYPAYLVKACFLLSQRFPTASKLFPCLLSCLPLLLTQTNAGQSSKEHQEAESSGDWHGQRCTQGCKATEATRGQRVGWMGRETKPCWRLEYTLQMRQCETEPGQRQWERKETNRGETKCAKFKTTLLFGDRQRKG